MDPSIVYINVDVAAPSRAVNAAQNSAVVFSETRQVPVVSRADRYFISVLRAVVSGADLPLFIPSVQLGQAEPALTTYVLGVSVSAGGSPTFTATAPVRWKPQVQGQQVPPAPLQQQFLGDKWYWCYSYQWMLDLVNATWRACMASLEEQYAAWWTSSGQPGPCPGLLTQAPAFSYDSAADRFGFAVQAPAAGESYEYAMNEPARGLFNHFNAVITPAAALPYVLRLPAPGADGYIRVQQPSSSTDFWSPISALSFCTVMPCVSEQSSPPTLLGRGDVGPQGVAQAEVQVITDVSMALARGDEYVAGLITYEPTASYRRVQMASSQPLTHISLSLWWKHKLSGLLIPLTLNPDGYCSAKLCLEARA